ncbi:hypothetical protein CU669_15100 [Paramagnetospirillum kuznetsovii]|uniref:Uncharacterized protein n=1 Tax=Paramagnetospirillum kuznetsovii TaxID=2053833 RepID=A0A364NVH1_9PROT|nr:hypothetical protein [Paramagnetospirillum kuznetsovii]RAU21081.1 hypothetical protein CU669_15100 [Paramagnetospirillum kuznetsovii]
MMARYLTSDPTWVFDKLIPSGEEFEVDDNVPPAKCWKRLDEPKRRGRKAEAAGEDDIDIM